MKLVILLTLIAIGSRANDAHACSCAMPRIEISPSGTDAPINSTVVVWLPSYESKGPQVSLSLRKKTSGDTVAVDFRNLGSAAVEVIELMPRAKLDANTEYEIVRVEKDGTNPVGQFTTGKHELTATPVWKGIAKASYLKAVPVCCMCMTADPYAAIELKEPIDAARAAQVRVAIWMAGADGKIDYKKSPVTYHEGSAHLWLGHPSTCAPSNFTFPRSRALRFGIKLVDLAGNASAASEFVLDTTKPIRPPAN